MVSHAVAKLKRQKFFPLITKFHIFNYDFCVAHELLSLRSDNAQRHAVSTVFGRPDCSSGGTTKAHATVQVVDRTDESSIVRHEGVSTASMR